MGDRTMTSASSFADTIVDFMSAYDGPPVVFAGYCAGFMVANVMSVPGAARVMRGVHLFTSPGSVGEFLSLPDIRPAECQPDSMLAETLMLYMRMEYGEDYRHVVFVSKTPVGVTAGVDDPVKVLVDDEAWILRPQELKTGASEYLTAHNSWVQARTNKDVAVVSMAMRALLGEEFVLPDAYTVNAVPVKNPLVGGAGVGSDVV